MKSIRLHFLIIFAFAIALLPPVETMAQGNDDEIFRLIEAGEMEKAKSKLKKKNSAQKLYYQALMEKNADRAFKHYNDVLLRHKKSRYAPLALYKIAQYYYVKKFVFAAQKRLEALITKYPDAENFDQAKTFLEHCQKATGTRTTIAETRAETSVLTSKTPSTRRRAHEPPAKIVTDASPKNESGKGKFRVQIGAYRNLENARSQKKYYALLGYPIDIVTVATRQTTLYKVYIGRFATRAEALSFGREFTGRFKIQYHIIEIK